MLPAKQTPKDVMKLRARNGLSLPIYYEKKIIRIGRDVCVLEVSKIPYESMIHIEQALKDKAIEKVEGELK